MLAGKFGFKVTSMSYPGRLYLLDPSRNWPGDTINPDGTVRTPIWNKDKLITPNQYEVVEDKSMMERYGTTILACAKEGTEFHHRMAGWRRRANHDRPRRAGLRWPCATMLSRQAVSSS